MQVVVVTSVMGVHGVVGGPCVIDTGWMVVGHP